MQKAKILLVNPWIHDFAAYDFWVKPLGLLTLASLLRASGLHVHVVDCLGDSRFESGGSGQPPVRKRKDWGCGKFRSEEIPKPEALRSIRRRYRRYGLSPEVFRQEILAAGRPELVLVGSIMTYWYPGVFETIRLVREVWPGVTVILGGNYATLCPDHARALSGADLVLTGDGEVTLPPVLGNLLGRETGFPFEDGDLDSYPYPALDLLSRFDAAPILTSRGCPFQCSYCASRRLNRGFRTRNPYRVVDEIEHWHRTRGFANFVFHDDALLVNATERAVPMLEDVIRRGLDVHFHCPNGLHLREMTPRLATLLFKSGFRTIRFGFETASAARQTETGGKVVTEELCRAVAYLREAGYMPSDIGVYLLCGMPGQEVREIESGVDLVREIGAKPILAEYSPIPGTPLWDEAVRHARYDIAGEPLFQNNSLIPCLSPAVSSSDIQTLKNRTRLPLSLCPNR